MREILFRGKHQDEWVYGDFIHDYGTQGDSIRGYKGKDNHGNIYTVETKTVGQYTGLTDKNGKKIFEGDIISHKFWNKEHQKFEGVKSIITFSDKTGDYADRAIGFWINAFWGDDFEVIGNIHDNPEFLEE